MVAILEFSAGYSIDEVIRAALSKINGYTLTLRKGGNGSVNAEEYDSETARDIVQMNNGVVITSYRWAFLEIIRHSVGHGDHCVRESTVYQRFPLAKNGDPTHDFQKYPAEPINVAPEDMIDLFPRYYINVLVTKIAKELCIPLRGDINMRRVMDSAYRADMAYARISDNKLAHRMGWFCE